MSKTITKWGRECKLQMVRRDLLLKDVAEATGYTRTYVSAVINGRVLVPRETQEKIGEAIGVDNSLIGT